MLTMLRRVVVNNRSCFSRRSFTSAASLPERKVVVLGASNKIGQPLSLLLKLNPLISTLSLYDSAVTGVADDLCHIDTRAEVKRHNGRKQLREALEGADVVVIPACVPEGHTYKGTIEISKAVVRGFPPFLEAIAKYCPHALINVIAPSVNLVIPYAAVLLMNKGVFDQRKLFGVTGLDKARVEKMYAAKAKVNVADVNVPVVGLHGSGLPLFSQAIPKADLSESEITDLTKRAKGPLISPTLSEAYEGSLFADACLKGLNGVPDVVEYSYVQSTVTELPFFASKVKLGKNGVEEVFGLGVLSDFEEQELCENKFMLDFYIRQGVLEAYQCFGLDASAPLVKYFFPTYNMPQISGQPNWKWVGRVRV